MARRRRGGRGYIDREIYFLVAVIFLLGLLVGYVMGKRVHELKRPTETKPKTSQQRPMVQPRPKPILAEPIVYQKPITNFPIPSFFKKDNRPKVAIVIDDVGYHDELASLIWQLPRPATLAVLPQLPYSEYFAKEGKKRGYDIILHQPMEPMKKLQEEDPGMIHANMDNEEIVSILRKNLKTVPTAAGMNNHQGSLATQDIRLMRTVLTELKNRRMFFLDSLTTTKSVAGHIAAELGLPYVRRHVFLDNEADPDYIHAQLEILAETARKLGSAVGIGHYKYETLLVLRDEIPRLEQSGIRIVSLKDLM